ncbi:hypothetical protein QAD02_004442 [Eretmocerus hayati]|uniref:Uncharacterized protein n=1 Tax=Eretmocerus hayati TaxID=131215 RepID=A0ACC2NPJ8_9HYME|nr:hypothetical protein QAD02_004442 [Eretmocerus hayati]
MDKSGRLVVDSKETPAPISSPPSNGEVVAPKEPISSDTIDNSNNTTKPTYRQLPDDDVNWLNRNNGVEKMGKQNGTDANGDPDDGAKERMLKDELKATVLPSKNASEVQFIPENGDAKIDMDNVKQSLSGMGKAELMKYANDPFWIKLRWFLFIMFWLLWAAMLFGAVAIIVKAPKCSAPQPKKWWEESPIVRLQPSDSGVNSFAGLEILLDQLDEHHVKAISLHSVLQETKPDHTEDFLVLKSNKGGEMDEFKKFIAHAKSKKQHVIMELDPNHSSDQHFWFNQSIQGYEPYKSYYVWADGVKDKETGNLLPPNNWLSVNGGSAWKYNDDRKQFYLHQFNESQPDLNYNNPAVIDAFSEIFKQWMSLGVEGFRLLNTRYLVEDPKLSNDLPGNNYPADKDHYSSLNHVHTKDHPQNAVVLRQWREVILNYTNGEGLFTLVDGLPSDILRLYNNENRLIDLPQSIQLSAEFHNMRSNSVPTALTLNQTISNLLKFSPWPSIDLNGGKVDLRRRINSQTAESITLMTLLLPATPILNVNNILFIKNMSAPDAAFNKDIPAAKNASAAVIAARKSQQFLYGETKIVLLKNETIFSYTRFKSGNPGYLVLYNSADKSAEVDVTSLPYMSEEINVMAVSSNYKENLTNTKLNSDKIPISSQSTLVATFVPKSKN